MRVRWSRRACAQLDFCAHGDEQFALCFDVAHLGNVFECDFFFGEDGGGHAGQAQSSLRPICVPFQPADFRRE